MGNPEGKKPSGSHRRRCEDNIKIDPSEIEGGMNWIYLPQNRDRLLSFVKTVMKHRVS
jgi:hypothetical protein